jgi:hypothetical protein
VDIENASQTALADNASPPGAFAAPPAGARWRQRRAVGQVDEGPHGRAATVGDAAAPAAPQRATRDIELWLLARRARGAALRLEFELRTTLARQVFRRDFVYVSRQLHALDASRRVQGLARADLDAALGALQRRADQAQSWIERQAADLQAAIDARGPANARISFACPARFQATIVSPAAHRLLELLQQADQMLALLEMAWLLGLVDPVRRTSIVHDCRRALGEFKTLACQQRQAIGELVRELHSQRKEGAAHAAPL